MLTEVKFTLPQTKTNVNRQSLEEYCWQLFYRQFQLARFNPQINIDTFEEIYEREYFSRGLDVNNE